MANKALISAARSMYRAKAAAGAKDYSYIFDAASKGIKALEAEQEKRLEEGKKESEQKHATVANIMTSIAVTDPSVGTTLQEIKDLDYEGVKSQASLFSSKESKQEGGQKRNQAIQAVGNLQQDAELLQSFYSSGVVSNVYTPAEKAALEQLTGDNMKKNVFAGKFKNEDGQESYGLYVRGTKDENGNPYRVADILGEKIQTVDSEAIGAYGESLSKISKKGRTDSFDNYDAEVGGVWADTVGSIKNSPQFGSFAFDKIYGKVWADDEIMSRFPNASQEEFIIRKNQLRAMNNGEDLGEKIIKEWGNTTDEDGNFTDQPFNIFNEWESDQIGMAKTAYADGQAKRVKEDEQKDEKPGKPKQRKSKFTGDYLFPSDIQSEYTRTAKKIGNLDYAYGRKDATHEAVKEGGKTVYIVKAPKLQQGQPVYDGEGDQILEEVARYNSYDDWWLSEGGWPSPENYIKKLP